MNKNALQGDRMKNKTIKLNRIKNDNQSVFSQLCKIMNN